MPSESNSIRNDLRNAYDLSVEARNREILPGWKQKERINFVEILRLGQVKSLIDIGSGPGIHAEYFTGKGLAVTCVDLSPGMVQRCIDKGIPAFLIDVVDLVELGQTFESAFAMNSLLHIPSGELPKAIRAIKSILEPDGLLYLGQYGGVDIEGIYEEDRYMPKRFFSRLTDERLKEVVSTDFEILHMKSINVPNLSAGHYQSLLLRNTSEFRK